MIGRLIYSPTKNIMTKNFHLIFNVIVRGNTQLEINFILGKTNATFDTFRYTLLQLHSSRTHFLCYQNYYQIFNLSRLNILINVNTIIKPCTTAYKIQHLKCRGPVLEETLTTLWLFTKAPACWTCRKHCRHHSLSLSVSCML